MPNQINNYPVFIITPFHGDEKILLTLKESLVDQLSNYDKWIIVYDNMEPNIFCKQENKQIILLQNNGISGAGNTRNVALDYIYKNYKYPHLLYPVDSDDIVLPNAISKIKEAFETNHEKVISFGHIKVWKHKKLNFGYSGVFDLSSLLKKYITPCGSTVIKIDQIKDLLSLKFGHRKRANDQLFFLNAVKKFKFFRCIEDPILEYRITNKNSVSSKKYKLILYKYLALRDFGINFPRSIFLMCYYAFYGLIRHIFKIKI